MAERVNNRYIVGIVIVAVVVLLNLPVPTSNQLRSASRDSIEPFESVFSFLIHRVRDVFSSDIDNEAQTTVPGLQRQVADLEQRMQTVRALEQENEELRSSLSFQKRARFELIPCEVIGRDDISGWWRTIRLNRGTRNGVSTNMAVVTVNGLIGRVHSVSRTTSDVLLISDSTTRISVKFPDGRLAGVLKGKGVSIGSEYPIEVLYPMSRMTVDFIDKRIELKDGTEVYTSGLGGVYPPGVKVGVIRNPRLHDSALFFSADLAPSDPMNDLRFAFVVNPYTPGPEVIP